MLAQIVVTVVVLVVSVVVHENAHGWTALMLGDPTAKALKRLSLNPLRHIDPIGSVIVPAFTAITGNPFGWAKPVPVDRHKLRWGDRGFALVALAGPLSNVVLAFLAIQVARTPLYEASLVQRVVQTAVIANVALAVFNMIPIPPLDGSRLLRIFLRPKGIQILDRVEPYGFLILMGILFLVPTLLGRIMQPVVEGLLRVLI